MLIAHEAPISILEDVQEVTDYDYALVHLFETHPEYYNFFKQAVMKGREVLLDNSIFELGTAFSADKFAKYVKELEPTFYVVPDVLENASETISKFEAFVNKYPELSGLKIGVVQGKTYQDIVTCYKYMSDRADYIAISFDYSLYQYIGTKFGEYTPAHLVKLQQQCSGRKRLISMIKYDGYWNYNKPHLLLGASLPTEFASYKQDQSIRSCDTSNPVMAGLFNHRYVRNKGLNFKSALKLVELIDTKRSDINMDDINYNINCFREICND
jgi:hypothetical protein